MHDFLEIFPRLCKLLPRTIDALVSAGMVLVCAYHSFCGNVFFNTTFEDAQGIEKLANICLSPVQYICDGHTVSYDESSGTYTLNQRFSYKENKKIYSPLSLAAFSSSLVLGSVLKSVAMLSPNVRARHQNLDAYLCSTTVHSNNDYYRSIGIPVENFEDAPFITPSEHKRRPGDENNLAIDKVAFAEIAEILIANDIPFWVDCGTCLGAQRYGGVIPWDEDVDIAVIDKDFHNVKHALNALDPKKYITQDWSSRRHPDGYIRVYIKENHNHIDIYHNAIDVENQTLTNILVHDESPFMATSWKIRERMFVKPIPFDVIFPLKKAHFDGLVIPVPNQIETYLTYKYGPDISPVKLYCEETDSYEKDLTHPHWLVPLAH